ncbi:MAG TPA: ornithine cyclodeaminase family protein [Chryseolinea sp.]
MTSRQTILLSRKDITTLLDIGTCIPAVEMAFRLYAEGKTQPPKVLAVHVDAGSFHIKAGAMMLDQHYFVAKTNANLPDNPKRFHLPTVQGILILFNADNGKALAVMDSMELTILRTGAATGVAGKYLSKTDSSTVTICGCGNQGIISLKAITHVRKIQTVYAFDVDHERSVEFSSRFSRVLGIKISPVKDLEQATRQSDICVTCTPSKQPLLFKRHVNPGCFVAAIGSDNEEKNEIDAELIASSKVVTDISEQCATIGDLHHALKKGKVSMSHIHAELGEVITGSKKGRTNNEEVIVFDSTGMALQDVAAAAIVYERALKDNIGLTLDFSN